MLDIVESLVKYIEQQKGENGVWLICPEKLFIKLLLYSLTKYCGNMYWKLLLKLHEVASAVSA